MQDVQTRMRFAAPFTSARTVWRLRFQRRFVTLCAWLIRLPNWGPRPQTSHTFTIIVVLLRKFEFINFGMAFATDLIFWQGITLGASALTDFNHIHSRDGEDWICGRSMAVQDEQLLHCEGRDPDEQEACRLCAERIIGYFGDPMHVH